MKIDRKKVRGDWESKNFGNGELKLIPGWKLGNNPKFEKMLNVVLKSETRKNPRKYTKLI